MILESVALALFGFSVTAGLVLVVRGLIRMCNQSEEMEDDYDDRIGQ